MQYFGGKQRIASKIAGIVGPFAARSGKYLEPFVGGASVMSLIRANVRIGSDANVALINMWLALESGWMPPDTISEEEYFAIKSKNDHKDPLTAFGS
jgi:DNA adenine methylase